MDTREKILQTATNLFNQQGTARVTTNHIAKEAGISPGNLYYHFQDKFHIIREIYEQMLQDWEPAYVWVEEQVVSFAVLKKFIEENFQMLWQYRFFNREMVALLRADPVLAERHITVMRQRFQRQSGLVKKAITDGVLGFPEAGAGLDDVLTIAWIVANHFLNYLEAMGQQVDQKDFSAGAELVMKVFTPYLTGNSGYPHLGLYGGSDEH